MAFSCPACSGTGKISGFLCWRCNGSGTIVEDSQGLAVEWGTVSLGHLRSFKFDSASCSVEDVTDVGGTVVMHAPGVYGMLKRVLPGDITPGTVTLSWIGDGEFLQTDIGQTAQLKITRGGDAPFYIEFEAFLLKFDSNFSTGELVTGTANFQLTGK